MEPALDERGDVFRAGRGEICCTAAMEPALDERGDAPGGRRLDPVLDAAMEPALDERGDLASLGRIAERAKPQWSPPARSEEHTAEHQARGHHGCRLLLERKKQ